MNIFEAIVLGIVQGLTEFLPVSSSGHLVIFQHLFGLEEAPITFDVLLHLGTLVAVFYCFRSEIWELIRRPFCRMTALLIVGCIPAALMGFFLEPFFKGAFESLLTVGIGLIITGFILTFSEKMNTSARMKKDERDATLIDALIVGIMQGIAILPGISRSGSTISASLMVGMNREFAARYSFLLSIPVILGASVLELKDLFSEPVAASLLFTYLIGMMTAAAFGYVAIRVVVGLVKKGRLSIFSYYCWAVGAIVIVASFF